MVITPSRAGGVKACNIEIFKYVAMLSPIAQRIGKFIQYKKISRRTFASKLGYVSSEKINRLFRKDGAKPGFDILADIANKFVDLNVDWLITGRGEMLKPVSADHPDLVGSAENSGYRPITGDEIREILDAIYLITSHLSENRKIDSRITELELQVGRMNERLKQMRI